MFDSKKTKLFDTQTVKATSGNAFTSVGTKKSLKRKSRTTDLGNKAVKYTTTGNDFCDQFGKITNYKAPRSFKDVSEDQRLLWSQDPEKALALAFYIRMITRTVVLPDGSKTKTTQRGQGLKHEGIFRLMWVAVNEPGTFWKNIALFVSVGSWKDIITMLSYDLQYNGWENRILDWQKFGQLILAGLENPNQSNLLKKYLPQIRAKSACKTVEAQADNLIAKWICSLIFGQKESSLNYKKYRNLKSSGTAHEWQKLISRKRLLDIDFNTVHGRALAQLVSGKFLKNNGLESAYEKWIATKPVAKYTGFVYELLAPVKSGYHNQDLKKYQIETINKQFLGLIETAKKGMNQNSSFLVVVDSSSSMTSKVPGTKVSAYDVAKGFALYFSYLLKGPFEGHFMEFADNASLIAWKGKTPVERLQNDRCEAYGSTNFQSVAQVFVSLFKKGVPESDFPGGILCVSDGCFNSTGQNKANAKLLKNTLIKAGFSKEYVDNFKIVLWDIPNNYYGKSQTAFEDFADTPNLYHISGLDGSAIAFLTGTEGQKSIPKTTEELFLAAIDQEVLQLIEI